MNDTLPNPGRFVSTAVAANSIANFKLQFYQLYQCQEQKSPLRFPLNSSIIHSHLKLSALLDCSKMQPFLLYTFH